MSPNPADAVKQCGYISRFQDHTLELTFNRYGEEHSDEEFVLDGEFVTYDELVQRFRKAQVDKWIRQAVKNAT